MYRLFMGFSERQKGRCLVSRKPQDQLWLFLSSLFHADDVVEVRPIEIWTDAIDGLRHSRVLRRERRWQTPRELSAGYGALAELNCSQRANIFMGANPRARKGVGRKCDIRTCRSVWADMDKVTSEVARWRCHEVGLPDPSIVVDSGSGVHLYWLLNQAFDVSDTAKREQFEGSLKVLYRQLGCDATSDVNRLLRLPGFWNMKDKQNGSPPLACQLIHCDPGRRFEIDRIVIDTSRRSQRIVRERRDCCCICANDGSVQKVLACLDHDVRDRSRRDFRVVCSLLRLGVRPNEIWSHVGHRSKFASRGYGYFETTLDSALKAITDPCGE